VLYRGLYKREFLSLFWYLSDGPIAEITGVRVHEDGKQLRVFWKSLKGSHKCSVSRNAVNTPSQFFLMEHVKHLYTKIPLWNIRYLNLETNSQNT